MIRKLLITTLAIGSFGALSACEAVDQDDLAMDEAALSAAKSTDPATLPQITEYIIDGAQMSPGYVAVEDLDKDGRKEVVVTTLMEEVVPSPYGPPAMKGAVHIYDRAKHAPLDQWTETVPFGTDKGFGFINMPQIADFNGDGKKDIALNTGFLPTMFGSQQYLVGPDFTTSVPFTAETAMTPYFYHELQQVKLDGDKHLDIVTTRAQFVPPMGGPPSINLAVDWYKGDGKGGYTRYTIDSASCGSMIQMFDVDGDKDQDIVCPQFFGPPFTASIVWFEQTAKPAASNNMQGIWVKHNIDATTGLGFDIRFVDIDKDGKKELVYANHNNQNNPMLRNFQTGEILPSGIYSFEIPTCPKKDRNCAQGPRNVTQWEKTVIDEGYLVTAPDNGNPASQGTPGLIDFADFDGNGRLDIVTSGDGADGLFVLLQNKAGTFTRHQIADGHMWGQAVAADIDNCGKPEIVAVQHGYPVYGPLPPGQVKIFKFNR